MSALETLFLVKRDPRAWGLMPQALARVRRFCRTYDSDDPLGDGLTRAIEQHFVTDAPGVVLRVVIEGAVEAPRIVGHALFTFEKWFELTYLMVLQYEMDRPYAMSEIRADLATIETWARARGADGMQLLARTPRLSRVFRRYGFQPHRILMRRTFAPSTGAPKPARQAEEGTIPARG